MCVIILAHDKRPTTEMVEQAWQKNDHGGGIAARYKDSEGKPYVYWKKDLTLEEMKEFNNTLELPYVLHFRLNTSGGILPELCHPFEVNPATPYTTEGSTYGKVLFHNGSWTGNWSDRVLDVALTKKLHDPDFELPPGKWSDTRALAFLMGAAYGQNFMDFPNIEQKGLVFGPTDYEIFWGKDGWTRVEDILCSNDRFWSKKSQNPGVCKDQYCRVTAGLVNGYCDFHKHQRPQQGSQSSQVSSTEQKLVCVRCTALLGSGAPHHAGCPEAHKGTAAGEVKETCTECHAVAGVGAGHTATCSKRTTKVLRSHLCQECKEHINDSRDHLMNCSKFLKGGFPKDAGASGGGRHSTPFLVLMVAEQMRRLGTLKGGISNNQMKRIKERLGLKHINTKDMDLSNLALFPPSPNPNTLKDPRTTTVTMH